MPLTAINLETGQRFVMPDDFDEARRMRESLVCPICDTPVHPVIDHLRDGAYVRACFRHKGDCETAYRYHPESPDHHAGKRWVLDNAPTLYGYADAQGASARPTRGLCTTALPASGLPARAG